MTKYLDDVSRFGVCVLVVLFFFAISSKSTGLTFDKIKPVVDM